MTFSIGDIVQHSTFGRGVYLGKGEMHGVLFDKEHDHYGLEVAGHYKTGNAVQEAKARGLSIDGERWGGFYGLESFTLLEKAKPASVSSATPEEQPIDPGSLPVGTRVELKIEDTNGGFFHRTGTVIETIESGRRGAKVCLDATILVGQQKASYVSLLRSSYEKRIIDDLGIVPPADECIWYVGPRYPSYHSTVSKVLPPDPSTLKPSDIIEIEVDGRDAPFRRTGKVLDGSWCYLTSEIDPSTTRNGFTSLTCNGAGLNAADLGIPDDEAKLKRCWRYNNKEYNTKPVKLISKAKASTEVKPSGPPKLNSCKQGDRVIIRSGELNGRHATVVCDNNPRRSAISSDTSQVILRLDAVSGVKRERLYRGDITGSLKDNVSKLMLDPETEYYCTESGDCLVEVIDEPHLSVELKPGDHVVLKSNYHSLPVRIPATVVALEDPYHVHEGVMFAADFPESDQSNGFWRPSEKDRLDILAKFGYSSDTRVRFIELPDEVSTYKIIGHTPASKTTKPPDSEVASAVSSLETVLKEAMTSLTYKLNGIFDSLDSSDEEDEKGKVKYEPKTGDRVRFKKSADGHEHLGTVLRPKDRVVLILSDDACEHCIQRSSYWHTLASSKPYVAAAKELGLEILPDSSNLEYLSELYSMEPVVIQDSSKKKSSSLSFLLGVALAGGAVKALSTQSKAQPRAQVRLAEEELADDLLPSEEEVEQDQIDQERSV